MSQNQANPSAPKTLDQEINDFFGGLFRPATPRQTHSVPMDVFETDDAYGVVIDLPGVDMQDVKLSLHEKTLKIEVKPAQQMSDPKQADAAETRWYRRDRPPLTFEESLRFVTPLNGEAVEAGMDRGVLTITLPKAEAAKPRNIQII
ncbi:MAG: Hsp20/alpha crystallin family protein [Planctomycetota bacterium]